MTTYFLSFFHMLTTAQTNPDANAANKSFTGLARLIASQAAATAKPNDGEHKGYNDGDDEDEGFCPLYLRSRINEAATGPDYIPPFTVGAVGRQYVVVKGIKPGIYSNW